MILLKENLGCPSSVNPTANVKQALILVLVFREKK